MAPSHGSALDKNRSPNTAVDSGSEPIETGSIHELPSAVLGFRSTTISALANAVPPSILFGVMILTLYVPGARCAFSSDTASKSGVYSSESGFPAGGQSLITDPCHSGSCSLSCILKTSGPNRGRIPGSTWTLADATGPSSDTETTSSADSLLSGG